MRPCIPAPWSFREGLEGGVALGARRLLGLVRTGWGGSGGRGGTFLELERRHRGKGGGGEGVAGHLLALYESYNVIYGLLKNVLDPKDLPANFAIVQAIEDDVSNCMVCIIGHQAA